MNRIGAPFERGIKLPSVQPSSTTETRPSSGFSDLLTRSLESVESTAQTADQTSEAMIAGHVDIHDAMIAMEKADLMIKMGATVRNKLLDAYRQLSQIS